MTLPLAQNARGIYLRRGDDVDRPSQIAVKVRADYRPRPLFCAFSPVAADLDSMQTCRSHPSSGMWAAAWTRTTRTASRLRCASRSRRPSRGSPRRLTSCSCMAAVNSTSASTQPRSHPARTLARCLALTSAHPNGPFALSVPTPSPRSRPRPCPPPPPEPCPLPLPPPFAPARPPFPRPSPHPCPRPNPLHLPSFHCFRFHFLGAGARSSVCR